MAGINRTTGKATDLITFSRASGGTALRKISYGSELAPSLSTAIKVGDAATTIAYNSGAGSLDIDAATTLDGAILLVSGVVVGRVYLFTADITLGTCTDSRITVGPSFTNQARLQSSGTVSLVFTAEDTQIRIDSYADTGTFTINSISVKEVLFDQPDGTLTLFNHPTNIPRIEYDAAGNVKGLLIEEARTNLVTHSIPDTNWSPIRASITENISGVIAPDGSQTVSKGIESVDNGSHRIDLVVTLTDAATYTYSVFAKAAERSMIAMEIGQGSISSNYARFNLSTGIVAAEVGTVSSTIEDFGDGWYRCSVTAAAGTTDRVLIGIWDGSTQSYIGDGTSGVYLWGAQLEAGSFPTSYIPTSGATATRAADIASISVDNFGYNQKAGTVVCEFDSKGSDGSDYPFIFVLTDGSNNNRISVGLNTLQNIGMTGVVGGAATISIYPAFQPFEDGVGIKTAAGYKKDNSAFSIAGNSPPSDTVCDIPQVTKLSIGYSGWASSYHLNGHIKSIAYYPRRLSNAQLVELTA